jgi:hypothetical protein
MSERTEKLAGVNLWGELMRMRDEQRSQRSGGVQVVKRADLPVELNPQGLMRWYMHPAIKDTALNTFMFYEQELPPGSRSGRLRFQGGQVMYILEGKGCTLIDGVRHRWEKGDVLNLPLRRDGIEVQHVNEDAQAKARFLACEPNLFDCTGVDRGSGFEQMEEAPEFRASRRS